MKIEGKVTVETVVEGVGAGEVRQVYHGRELGELVGELMADEIGIVQFLQGDGGVGTIVNVTFPPGVPGVGYLKEIFTKIDDEKQVKETRILEGGFEEMGVDVYRVCLEISDKFGDESTIIRSTIEYGIDEQFTNVAPLINTKQLETIVETSGKYLCERKKVIV